MTVNKEDILLVIRVGEHTKAKRVNNGEFNYCYDTGFFFSSFLNNTVAIQLLAKFDKIDIFKETSSFSKQLEDVRRKLL